MELDRFKRRINRVKGFSTSPEHLQLIQQEKSLAAQLKQIQLRRKSLSKQALKVQVFQWDVVGEPASTASHICSVTSYLLL